MCYSAAMAATLAEIDDVLIRYGDTMSLQALSFKLEGALSPEACGARLTHLLESPDWLTATQKDAAITLKMQGIINRLEEMPLTTRSGEVILAGLERVGNRLDKRQAATEKDLTSLYSFQGTVLFEAIEIAMAHMRGQLTQGVPELEATWDDALETALRFAQIELAKHEAVEA